MEEDENLSGGDSSGNKRGHGGSADRGISSLAGSSQHWRSTEYSTNIGHWLCKHKYIRLESAEVASAAIQALSPLSPGYFAKPTNGTVNTK